tara:strand:+ start:1473 stop:1877 length:405 start_codon:yes stop_codon:yes gene_type:complete
VKTKAGKGYRSPHGIEKRWMHAQVRPVLKVTVRNMLFGGFPIESKRLAQLVEAGDFTSIVGLLEKKHGRGRARPQAIKLLEEISKRHLNLQKLCIKLRSSKLPKGLRANAQDSLGHLASMGAYANMLLTELRRG